jgi:hypothetical protein
VGIPIPAYGQGGSSYQWSPPVNSGEMPTNVPLLPNISIMPTLPLDEPLIPGTLIFSVEDFSDGYSIVNLTLDERLYAYNITNRYGIYPISPNGQYGIFTVPDGATDVITCGIMDMLTGETVDQFETIGICRGTSVYWSPDSTRIFFQAVDEAGRPALGIRGDGQTTIFRPIPVDFTDLGGETLGDSWDYFIGGWISNDTVTYDIGIRGTYSQQLYTTLDDLDVGRPIPVITAEETGGRRLILSRPAQPLEELNRGVWLTDIVADDTYSLAPIGNVARLAEVSPDDSQVVYWVETEASLGTVHPLRLVVYSPDSEEHTVLLQFDGPQDGILVTRPGELIWNPEGIYFHISQQPGAVSPLQSGTYRIQPDGSDLTFVSPEQLWGTLTQ